MNVTVQVNTEVQGIIVEKRKGIGVETNRGRISADYIVGTGDYHHLEQDLLEKPYRNLTEKYWEQAVLAPSMFILYLGIGKKIPQLAHHNIFFSAHGTCTSNRYSILLSGRIIHPTT